MQKIKRLLIVCMICVLSTISIALVACNNDHDHKFDKWDHDETHHWKVCSVEGCTEKDDSTKAEHKPDASGKCECGYEKSSSGHQHDYENGAWIKYDNEYHVKQCKSCNSKDIAHLQPHNFDSDGVCEDCNYEKSDEPDTPPVAEHTHTPITVDKVAATCVSTGVAEHYSCTFKGCNKLFSDRDCKNEITLASLTIAIDANNHAAITLVSDKAATCLEGGNKAYFTCKGCNKNFEEQAAETEIEDGDTFYFQNALGHTYDDNTPWTVVDPATCTADGLEKHECTRCDENTEGHKVTRKIDKLGHDFGTDADWVQVDSQDVADCQHGVALERFCKHTETGCTEKQTKTSDPDMTNHVYEEKADQYGNEDAISKPDLRNHYYQPKCTHVGPKAEEHDFSGENDECVKCGYAEIFDPTYHTPGLRFSGTSGVATVQNPDNTFTGGDVIIPAKYNNMDVTSIGWYAFQDRASITSIVIPNTITIVSLNAMYNCEAAKVDRLTVYYMGTAEKWATLIKAVDDTNAQLKYGNVYFYSDEPAAKAWHWSNRKAVVWDYDYTNHNHTLTEVKARPACVIPGVKAHYVCSGCDKIFSDNSGASEITEGVKISQLTGHDYSYEAEEGWTVSKKPTCSVTGTKTRPCKNGCGSVESRTIDKDANNHPYSWVSDKESGHHKKAACSHADQVDSSIVPHVYEGDSNICKDCRYDKSKAASANILSAPVAFASLAILPRSYADLIRK